VSVRQLERLFAKHLGVTIGQHYLALRLTKAQVLLRQTSLPIVQIGAECGFANASHFARVYRERFATLPSRDRMR
jgi:transcriptional regulator GlxA family with amidase domain